MSMFRLFRALPALTAIVGGAVYEYKDASIGIALIVLSITMLSLRTSIDGTKE